MGLSKEEKQQLESLQAKAKERDKPPGNLNLSVDLGDPEQVKQAQKFGYLPSDDDEDDGDDGGGDDGDDETPRRRGYFRD